jgi:predicted dithiol-disulfide oxidoreductase (DUF899 family)
MKEHNQSLPKVVSQAEWQSARDKLLVKEKAHTRAGDALTAERRRLPMVTTRTISSKARTAKRA